MCNLYGGALHLDIALGAVGWGGRREYNIAYFPYFVGFVLLEVGFFFVGLCSFSFVYAVVLWYIYQWLTTDWWLSPGTPVSSTNKTDRHDITEILLKVKHHKPNQTELPFACNMIECYMRIKLG